MNSNRAVLYVRSSKDRSDVSIDAQRHELQRLAQSKGLEIVGEYADVVFSAKDERRPEFQRLRADLKASGRGWGWVLLLDPSRLSRNQFVAHWFTFDAKKYGARILYARMPEANPMVDIIVTPIMHAFAEYHSWESKQKGLAGMAENVRRGFRAGGRAPYGYRLEHVDTGILREGQSVQKSHLVPTMELEGIGEYLRGRAAGEGRAALRSRLKLAPPENTLVGIEWNALTYAGHTVWNVHNERIGGRYAGGQKRRPRAAWQIQRDTHPAVITDDEAEAILARLEAANTTRKTHARADYLFTGLLETPEGRAWHGDSGSYRVPGKRVQTAPLDRALVDQIFTDLRSTDFAAAIARQARKMAADHQPVDTLEQRRGELKKLDTQIRRMADLAAEASDVRIFLTRARELQAERLKVEASLEGLEREAADRTILAAISEKDIQRMLESAADQLAKLDREDMKALLSSWVERVTMDPLDLTCRIHYKIPASSGKKVASPRRLGDSPVIKIWRKLRTA